MQWKRGGYDLAALSNIYTGNDARDAHRAQGTAATRWPTLRRCVPWVSASASSTPVTWRIGSSTPAFRPCGVGRDTRPADREAALTALRNREINVLFAVDLFNEGLDIPEVDTVLFLRPTESATVFLQQLGRGLRLDARARPC